MIGIKTPRLLVLAVALGAAVSGIMLSVFYVQYQWLAQEIVTTSSAERDRLLAVEFQIIAQSKLELAGHELGDKIASPDEINTATALNAMLLQDTQLAGVQFTSTSGATSQAGSFPPGPHNDSSNWLDNRLILTTEVGAGGKTLGELSGAFDLEDLRTESRRFSAALADAQVESSRVSYLWAAAGTAGALTLCGLVVWLLIRGQTKRIRQLKTQAEKLRDSDFGEPLATYRGDELGELASVFNEMRQRLRSTTHSRDYVDSILSGMNEAVIVTSELGMIQRINTATTHLLGYEEDELLDTNIDFLVNTSKSASLAADSPSGLPKEAIFESKYGESIPVSYTCSVVDDNADAPATRVYAAQNITERRRAEKRIRYLARIDPLTKIPNRMQFQHLLQRGIARARRADKSLCLFYIDVDHFKEINDTFGHLAGDTTLETVAERLKSALPNHSIVGRLAGDEFAVIVDDLGPDEMGIVETSEAAQKLLDRLADPFFVQGHEVFMTASLGIAYYPKDAPNVIDLIRNADAALYHSKKTGGNVFSYYAPKMNEDSVERLMTKSKLKRAFERDELLVHYQPKYNLETGEVFGAEALVRWELPERGLILPSDFIPIAEETNLIIEIGEWVLDKVCEDFRIWQRSVSSPGRVSVNLSLKQLRQLNFISRIGSIMRSHEVSPTSLELEITETTLMENPERTIKLLDQLYGLGLHLAIDDFGTGYSSLSALQQFPISTLKIDRSFVRDIVNNPDDATIVDTIIQMGRNMNMDVVAEGVEGEAQLNFLQKLGCTYVQGLLFGDPMSADNYLELLLAQADGTDTYRALFA
ncbi:MAG: EAL domain-containing protein [Gammaproteobacteria bacterium]|nr:EAL domain-containing protein [Gammaproteobacteria bacterium]